MARPSAFWFYLTFNFLFVCLSYYLVFVSFCIDLYFFSCQSVHTALSLPHTGFPADIPKLELFRGIFFFVAVAN